MQYKSYNPYPAPELHELPSVAGVVALLNVAKAAGLQFPKLWLQLPGAMPLRISIAACPGA